MNVKPLNIRKGMRTSGLLEAMADTAFNARRLGEAARIYAEMVEKDTFIFLAFSGALIPAGMRNIIADMVERGFASCIVTTGANIVHEIAEALGYRHEKGDAGADDLELSRQNINRIYDVFISQNAFEGIEEFLIGLIQGIEGRMGTYEFIREVGLKLPDKKSFLHIAARKDIPVFSPTLHDSIAGLHLSIYSKDMVLDVIKDVRKMVDLCFQDGAMGTAIFGGGVPKNFTLQAMLLAEGFDYAIQITTDSPQWGGLSGATLEEAKSWCKLKSDAKAVTVYCDATIALPLLHAYLVDRFG